MPDRNPPGMEKPMQLLTIVLAFSIIPVPALAKRKRKGKPRATGESLQSHAPGLVHLHRTLRHNKFARRQKSHMV